MIIIFQIISKIVAGLAETKFCIASPPKNAYASLRSDNGCTALLFLF